MADGSFVSPLGPGLAKLLELFGTRLAEVKFPDVDATLLATDADAARQSATDVAAARSAHLAAEAALATAEAALVERERALLLRAQRALAYARVFAADDAQLRAELDRIALPSTESGTSEATTRSLPGITFRKRARPRKPRGETQLPSASQELAQACAPEAARSTA